jgi:iron complex outermembrane receptor protein
MMVWRNRSCTTGRRNKRINANWSSTALIAGSSLLFVPLLAAHAEGPAETSASPSQPPQAEAGSTLEEIIITARRRSEVLQDVPQTVTAVTSGELQKLNLQNLKDLSGVVPGLQIVASDNRALDANTFRGVSFQPATGTQNTLGFYINDTFVTNNFVTTSNFDIGQIELLSGPQGTLRGEPSPSGSLTITTRRPDLEQFGGYVTVTGTQYDNTNENGAVNLPIIKDKLAVRLAGLADDDDLDGVKSVNSTASPYYHSYAGRVSVRYEPIDAIEANVMYQHLFWHSNQFAQVTGPGAAGGVNPNAPANYNGPAISPTQRLGVQTFPTTQYNKQDLVTGQLDWHFLGQLVSYDGSYFRWQLNNGDGSLAANQVPGITAANPIPRKSFQSDTPSTTQRTQTDELRIASETPIFGFLDYTAGAFYRHTGNEVNVVQNPTFLPGSFGPPSAAANPFIYNSKYTLQVYIVTPADEKEHSEFAHLTFHLPYNTELTTGGRHIDYKKTGFLQVNLLPQGVFVGAALPSSICNAIGGLPGATYPGICDIPATSPLVIGTKTNVISTQQNLTDHAWIYNVSLSHKLNENLLAYVNGGSSWRPPGISVGINNAANDPVLNSLLHLKTEKSTDIEGGFKWTFLDNRARLNAAYYHQKFNGFIYNGLPILYLSDTGSGSPSVTGFSFNTNPDAVLNGVELDTGLRLTRQWNFDLTATYANGHLTGSAIPCSPPSGGQTAAAFPPGTHIFLCPSHASTSVTPNFNFSAQTEYDMPVPGASGVDGFVRGLYTFSGRNPHASQFYVTPSYGILNLYLGLRSADGAWEGAFFAKNFLNAKKVLATDIGNPAINASTLNLIFGSSGYNNTIITPRQEFGLTVTYSIGSR